MCIAGMDVPEDILLPLCVAYHYEEDVKSKGPGCGKRNLFERKVGKKCLKKRRATVRKALANWFKLGEVSVHAASALRSGAETAAIEWLKGQGLNVRNGSVVQVMQENLDDRRSGESARAGGTAAEHAGDNYPSAMDLSISSDEEFSILSSAPAPIATVPSTPQMPLNSGHCVMDDTKDTPDELCSGFPADQGQQKQQVPQDCDDDIDDDLACFVRPLKNRSRQQGGLDDTEFVSIYEGMTREKLSGAERLINQIIFEELSEAEADRWIKAFQGCDGFDPENVLPTSARTVIRQRTAMVKKQVGDFIIKEIRTKKQDMDENAVVPASCTPQAADAGARTNASVPPPSSEERTQGEGEGQSDVYQQADGEVQAKERKRVPRGQYVHFGITSALMAVSPGLYHWADYIALLRRVEALKPGILPQKFLEIAFGPEIQQARALVMAKKPLPPGYFWYQPDLLQRPEMLLFTLQMHVDGVQLYENSTKGQGIPILGSIHEIIPFNPTDGAVDYTKGASDF